MGRAEAQQATTALAVTPGSSGGSPTPGGKWNVGSLGPLTLDASNGALIVECVIGCSGSGGGGTVSQGAQGSSSSPWYMTIVGTPSVTVTSNAVTPAAHGGSITTGGHYQTVLSPVANWLCITNTSTDWMHVSPINASGTVLSNGDDLLSPAASAGLGGGRACYPALTGGVSVEAATTGDTFNANGS